jgi:hypothetical protein
VRWGIVLGVLAGLLWGGSAQAGIYTVHSCSLPSGAPAPIEGWTYSWGEVPGGPGWNVTCSNPLAAEQAISAWAENTWVGTYSRFTFAAPRDTVITGYTLYRYERANSAGGAVGLIEYGGTDGVWLDGCGSLSGPCAHGSQVASLRLSAVNRVRRESFSANQLSVTARCTAYPGSATSCDSGSGAWISIYASQIDLSDAVSPVLAGPPSGSLFDAVAGAAQTVKVVAQDRGGGVATATLLIDGRRVATAVPDTAAAKCVTPYVSPVPCPLESSFHIDLDTRSVPNGAHEVRVEVADAAGNVTRSEARTAIIHNDGAANGFGASRLAVLSGAIRKASRTSPLRRLVDFGQRVDLAGKLTDANGAPIGGAKLVVEDRIDRPGETWQPVGDVVTGADGTWTAAAGSGASRAIRVSYRAFSADPTASAEVVAAVRVRARISLTVAPRRTGPTGRIVFRGRLVGGPGRRHTQVTLYALPGHGRRPIPVAVRTADSRGRFRYAYRFSGAFSNLSYTFQARTRSQTGYPYAPAASKKVVVRVRG